MGEEGCGWGRLNFLSTGNKPVSSRLLTVILTEAVADEGSIPIKENRFNRRHPELVSGSLSVIPRLGGVGVGWQCRF